jgi:hypothetical protein
MEAIIDKMTKIIKKTITEIDNPYCTRCLQHDLVVDIEYLKENKPSHFIWGVRDCGTETIFGPKDIHNFMYWTREKHYRRVFSIKNKKFRKVKIEDLDAVTWRFTPEVRK